MNTSKLADMSEIVSSIAILITIVFLMLQMQQNTKAIEASARQGASDADAQQVIQVMNNSDDAAIKTFYNAILYMRNRENEWAQYKNGVMDEITWHRLRSSLALFLSNEKNNNWWVNVGNGLFNPEFVEEVNTC